MLLPYDEVWLGDTCRLCDHSFFTAFGLSWESHLLGNIVSFQLLDFPGGLIYWIQWVLSEPFYKHWVSPGLPLLENSRFQIRTGPHPWFLSCSDNFPRGCVHQPAKVCASSGRAWELDAASDLEFLLILLSGFPVAMSIPGLLDAIGLFAFEELVGTCEDKFIAVDFDFATRLYSSLFCSCIVFGIVLGQRIKLELLAQQVELKWLMLNEWRRLFHSSRVKLPLVNMSASWCLVSMYRIWTSRIKINPVKQPIQSNSVGS